MPLQLLIWCKNVTLLYLQLSFKLSLPTCLPGSGFLHNTTSPSTHSRDGGSLNFQRREGPHSPRWTTLPGHTLFCHLHSRSSLVSLSNTCTHLLTSRTFLSCYNHCAPLVPASGNFTGWMTLVTPKGTAQRLPPVSKGFTSFTFQSHISSTTPWALSLPGKTPPLRSRLPNLWLQLSIYFSTSLFLDPVLHPSSFILDFALLHLTHLSFSSSISLMGPQGHQFQWCSH